MIQKLDNSKCKLLLSQNYIGQLSYIFNDRPYIVPITYFYDALQNAIIGYSGKGHKIRALRINRDVAVGVYEVDSVNNWKSVLVQGSYREFEGSTAKINLHKFSEGVKEIISNKEGKNLKYISEFSSKIYKEGPPIVFKIDIEDIIGKERKYI
ncbi:MAG: flavin mononucleotide-binding protein [Winogradskyella sp.]|uniref:pyridoxamine 5'-phosphate oxidase family protein n=1 Tax=Winogradskyella sp. TaxID=1883156 RepID=UPI0017ADD880|nr:pyridoxamine 5'-phosphate oxidase family protein [Winogradskyella sp.]MBT8244448.1 pyridoxamine 5'-phosphate oxidase family protein [Winogradskyella sp.]NNK22400.1 flavin mononucleotide-binding protein [Winogradskyella sp.]